MQTAVLQVQYRELAKVISAFGDNPYAVIKGAPLSIQCYDNPISRGFGDLDVLIPKRLIPLFEQICKEMGFTPLDSTNSRLNRVIYTSFSHQAVPYIKKYLGINVEIDPNYDIFWGEYKGRHVDIDSYLLDTVDVEVCGVSVKTLPPLKAFVQLILHHYKDMNSIFLLSTRNSIRYDMFRDVYYLLKNNIREISIEKLFNISCEYDILPFVFYILYYTGAIYEDVFLKRYIDAFRTPTGVDLLECYGLCDDERKVWQCSFNERIESEDIYKFIEPYLTEKDKKKINLNKLVFMGERL